MQFRRTLFAVALAAVALASTSSLSETALDAREPVERSSDEQVFVLQQMRLFLETIAALQDDLARGDMAKASTDAAQRGVKVFSKEPKPPHLSAKESPDWKAYMLATRRGFDEIADKAAAGAGKDELQAVLAGTMQNCVACHKTYRIVVRD